MGEQMTLSRTFFATFFLLTTFSAPCVADRTGRTTESGRAKVDAAKADAARQQQGAAARQQVDESARRQDANKLGGASPAPKLGAGAAGNIPSKTDPRNKAVDHRPGKEGGAAAKVTNKKGKGDGSRFAADVLGDEKLPEMVKKLVIKGPDGKPALAPETEKRGKAIDDMKMEDSYQNLRGAFNTATVGHKTTLEGIKKKLADAGSKLSAKELETLETAILVFLKRAKLEGAAEGDTLAQLNDLMKDFGDELADPKQKDLALKYIMGTLAYYGNTFDGQVQLSAAKKAWHDITEGKSFESLTPKQLESLEGTGLLMEARANSLADRLQGKAASDVNWKEMFELNEADAAQWMAVRLRDNGVPLDQIPDTVRQLTCNCSGNKAAVCNK